jgi:hypothetical protein
MKKLIPSNIIVPNNQEQSSLLLTFYPEKTASGHVFFGDER